MESSISSIYVTPTNPPAQYIEQSINTTTYSRLDELIKKLTI